MNNNNRHYKKGFLKFNWYPERLKKLAITEDFREVIKRFILIPFLNYSLILTFAITK